MTHSTNCLRAVAMMALIGASACSGGERQTRAASQALVTSQADQLTRWRQALDEDQLKLSDREVTFLHEALIRDGGEYQQRGFETFLEWGLRAIVRATAKSYVLHVVPTTGRVNAEWELLVNKESGEIVQGDQGSIVAPR